MMFYSNHAIGKFMIGAALVLQGTVAFSEEMDMYRSRSNSVATAFALYEEGKFDEAALTLRPYAQQGNARAQLYLATLYRTGSGVEEDEYEAAEWYGRAAKLGVAEAQFHLGLMYLEGCGVTEDSDRALEWVSRAAAQGFDDAVNVYRYILDHDASLNC